MVPISSSSLPPAWISKIYDEVCRALEELHSDCKASEPHPGGK